MFRGLKARRVVVNLTNGEAFRGRVVSGWWFTLRLAELELLSNAGTPKIEGVMRIPRRAVINILEL